MKREINILYKNSFLLALVCLMQIIAGNQLMAQNAPIGSGYFQNQYVFNPAMAGMDQSIKATLSHKQQLTDYNSSPKTQYLTAEYGFSENVGLGLLVTRRQWGVLEANRIMATYAYHLRLSDNQYVSFGLSAGAYDERVDEESLVGDGGDPTVAAFNDNGIQFDTDFGLTYGIGSFIVQASGTHLATYIYDEGQTTLMRQPSLLGGISYRFMLKEGIYPIYLTPKALYRKVDGFKEVIDVGAKIDFLDDKINFFTMYHSSKNATVGFGAEIKRTVNFNIMYTSQAADFENNMESNIEFALQLKLDDIIGK